MKSKILLSFSIPIMFCLSLFAQATPITEDVVLVNNEFSKAIYQALEGQIIPVHQNMMAGSVAYLITIDDGFSCMKSTTKKKTSYTCALLVAGGWKAMGMESYGSGKNAVLSELLFESLDAPMVDEDGIQMKSIELDVADKDGGTERNQIVCYNPLAEAKEMGFRSTCQIINAL